MKQLTNEEVQSLIGHTYTMQEVTIPMHDLTTGVTLVPSSPYICFLHDNNYYLI